MSATDERSDTVSTETKTTDYSHSVVVNGPHVDARATGCNATEPTERYFPATLMEEEGWKPVGKQQDLTAFQIDKAMQELAREEKESVECKKRMAEALFPLNAKKAKPGLESKIETGKSGILDSKVVIFKRNQRSHLLEFGMQTRDDAVVDKLGYPFVFDKTNAWIANSLPAGLCVMTRNLQEPDQMVKWILAKDVLLTDKPFVADVVGANGYGNSTKIDHKEMFLDDSAIMVLINGGYAKYLGTPGMRKNFQKPVLRMTETRKRMVANRVQRRRLNSRVTAVGTEKVYIIQERELILAAN